MTSPTSDGVRRDAEQLAKFGTGYSSLSYLHRLQADTVKVDVSEPVAAAAAERLVLAEPWRESPAAARR